jgi:hypothetical protein
LALPVRIPSASLTDSSLSHGSGGRGASAAQAGVVPIEIATREAVIAMPKIVNRRNALSFVHI